MATIPVIIDALRSDEDEWLARCRYYSIACDEPVSTSFSLNTGKRIPFLLIGLTGMIHKPLGRSQRFTRPDQITDLFDTIEEDGRLYVATNELWLPHSALTGRAEAHGQRGMVYRVPTAVFPIAQAFSHGQLSREELAVRCGQPAMRVTHSPAETNAFAAWSALQIETAREHYNRSPDRALKWTDTAGGTP